MRTFLPSFLLPLFISLLFVFSCDDGNFDFTQNQFTVTNETNHTLLIGPMDAETAALFDPASYIVTDRDNPDLIADGESIILSRNDVKGGLETDETLLIFLFSENPELNNDNVDIPTPKDEILLFYAGMRFFQPSELEENNGFIKINFN